MNLSLKSIYTKLEQENLDGLIVSSTANISYLTKFTSHDAYLLVSKKGNVYITDFRYLEAAKRDLSKNFTLRKINGSVFKVIASTCKDLGLRRIGFEARHLVFGEYKKIKEELDRTQDLISTHSLTEGLRQIKDKQELAKIKRATQITISALKFIQDFISPGKKEIEVAAELERFIRYQGADAAAFNIIVASGPNSSFPHHKTGQRKLKNNEPVLIDLGVDYHSYKSDLTRVFFLGKISSEIRRIYDIVLKAQARAINKVKPGVVINQVDRAARQYIREQGYGGFFGHNLGHGIGLEVHEEPHISPKEDSQLKPGMVFTIEPAIYLPDKFGIRIEDAVAVTQRKVEVISDGLHK